MPQRRRAARSYFTQRKAGVNILDVGHIHQLVQRKLTEGFRILGNEFQLKSGTARVGSYQAGLTVCLADECYEIRSCLRPYLLAQWHVKHRILGQLQPDFNRSSCVDMTKKDLTPVLSRKSQADAQFAMY